MIAAWGYAPCNWVGTSIREGHWVRGLGLTIGASGVRFNDVSSSLRIRHYTLAFRTTLKYVLCRSCRPQIERGVR